MPYKGMKKVLTMQIALFAKEPLMQQALASLLANEGNCDVVVQANGPIEDFLKEARSSNADVLLVKRDQLTPEEYLQVLGAKTFGGDDVKLVLIGHVLTGEDAVLWPKPDDRVSPMNPSSALFEALEKVAGGMQAHGSAGSGRRSYGNGNELTKREDEVAHLVAKGLSNRKISQITGLREQSIKNLVSMIMRKLSCENRVQVALNRVRRDPPLFQPAE
jgi:DNA-binding NarL/FixJ family response regulator